MSGNTRDGDSVSKAFNVFNSLNKFHVLPDECENNVNDTVEDNRNTVEHTILCSDLLRPTSNEHGKVTKNHTKGTNLHGKNKRRPTRRSTRKKRVKSSANVKIVFNNIRGVKSKRYELCNFVKSNNVDVLGLVETFLKDDESLNIKGYNWVGKNRPTDVKKSQGGIGLLIKDNVKILDDNVLGTRSDNYERTWVKVQFSETSNSVYYIAVVYFPCEGTDRALTDELYTCLLAEVLKIQHDDDGANIVITGDMNGKIGTNIRNGDKVIDYNGKGLLDFCASADLNILNCTDKCSGIFTWVKNQKMSVLDYVIVSQSVYNETVSLFVDDMRLYHLGSDHNILLLNLTCSNDHRLNKESFCNTNTGKFWNVKPNQDWSSFQAKIKDNLSNWDPNTMTANGAWDEWKKCVLIAAEESIGYKSKRKNCKGWFDDDIQKAINTRQEACQAHRHYCKNKGKPDFDQDVGNALWADYQNKRIQCKSVIRRKIMQMRVDRCSNIMKRGGPQCREFWQQLKGNKPINKVTSIRIPGTSQTTSDRKIMESSIKMYFNTLGKMNHNLNDISEDDSYNKKINDQNKSNTCTNKLDTLEFSINDVRDAISQCKNNKSPGIDLITNELIKNGGDGMVMSLFNLFKRLTKLECIPDEWNKGIIIPIFKKGDQMDLNNYRGITLTSCISKVYNRIISQTVSKFVEDNNILTEVQGSFRKDRRCEDHVFTLKSIIAARKAEGKQTFLAFLDFKKAFDTVWRDGLLTAARKVGITGSLLRILSNMYTNVECKVKFSNIETSFFSVDEGVKQGCVLSPILFCIYINELAKMIKQTNLGVTIFNQKIGCLFWADDVVLIGENEKDLNLLLDTASEFSRRWKLSFNYDKSNVLITGQKTNPYRKWRLCDHFINETSTYKYLGIHISRDQSDNVHIVDTVKKGNRIISYIKSIIDNQEDFNRVYYGDLLWKSIGLSSINYGCSVWFCKGKSVMDKIENLQYQMARIILKAPRNVAKEALYGDLGWQSIASIQNNCRVQYFNRLKNMDNSRWPKLLFNAIFAIQDDLKWGWLRNVSDVLIDCDMGAFYNTDHEITTQGGWGIFFKNTNKAVDHANWYNNAQSKSTLSNYIKYKTCPSLEPYLLDSQNFTGCNLKFKARTNTLNLEGRKTVWSKDFNGICKLCNDNTPETIDHFMFECTSLATIRETTYNTMKNIISAKGWDTMWHLFMNGNIEMKRHLMLDNIFKDNYELGNIFDQGCKQLLMCAWKYRTEIYNNK